MVNRANAYRAAMSATVRWISFGIALSALLTASTGSGVELKVIAVAPAAPAAAADAAQLKEAEAKAEVKSDAKLGANDAAKVNDGQVLGFRQSEVAAQMTELEERMFRLSEAIKQLEPENASRLMLGLKFAREELILHQMRETQQLLDKLSLGEAMAEQKHLLSKLQRLHDMLLSADLDLQMRLERLRQVREILRRLEKAIAEEEREQRQSHLTAGLEKQIEHLRQTRLSLDELIKRQKAHVAQGKELAAAETPDDEQTTSIGELAEAQGATRGDAQKLSAAEAQGGTKLEELDKAVDEMKEAAPSLAAKDAAAALPHQQAALEALQRQATAVSNELGAAEAELSAEKFAALQKEQLTNHQFTDGVADSVRKLGDTGAAALGSLQASTGSMAGAEKRLGLRQAEPASTDQASAVDSLKKARLQLSGELSKLLNQLRAEIKRRVLEDLGMMLEKQIAIRESTVVLSARVNGGGRQVLASIIALSASEAKIINVADELVALVEETEFGIALPAALTMVRDGMAGVKTSLAAADASEPVVEREREIETDLKDLIAAMKQLPAKGSGKDGESRDGDDEDRERELNRVVAELKMIRLVQVRVNRSTLQTDGRRAPEVEVLSPDVRRLIESVTNQQDDVREVTERLFTERADDIP